MIAERNRYTNAERSRYTNAERSRSMIDGKR